MSPQSSEREKTWSNGETNQQTHKIQDDEKAIHDNSYNPRYQDESREPSDKDITEAAYPGAAIATEDPAHISKHNSNSASSSPRLFVEDDIYPEGGRDAYLCVFGSFCACIISIGRLSNQKLKSRT